MRLAAFLLALPLFGQSIPFPGPGMVHTTGGGAITLLTHVCAFSGDTNTVTTTTINTTGATLLVVTISDYQAALAQAVPSDSKMNTWTSLTTYNADLSVRVTTSYVANPTVGTLHTFTATGSVAYPSICVASFSGVVSMSPLDQQHGQGGVAAATTLQPGSITPSQNNELVITGLAFDTSGTVSIDSGFTITDQTDYMPGAAFGAALAYIVQTTAGAVNPTWTFAMANAAAAQSSYKAP